MQIPEPDINFDIGSSTHAEQTGRMMMHTEKVLMQEKSNLVLVYGDTNSTLTGALATVKLHIPVVLVEAGLRSYNPKMPEEHNRILTDHCSDIFFCPTKVAVSNLGKEGITNGVKLIPGKK